MKNMESEMDKKAIEEQVKLLREAYVKAIEVAGIKDAPKLRVSKHTYVDAEVTLKLEGTKLEIDLLGLSARSGDSRWQVSYQGDTFGLPQEGAVSAACDLVKSLVITRLFKFEAPKAAS